MFPGSLESLAHVPPRYSLLVQKKYLLKHNAAPHVLFFAMLRNLGLADSVSPWYSLVDPKYSYKSPEAKAYGNVPVLAEHEHLPQDRVDARFIDHKGKKDIGAEISYPWNENRAQKGEDKAKKYGRLRWKLKQQYPGYCAKQHNNIIDVLDGWSRGGPVDEGPELFWERVGETL